MPRFREDDGRGDYLPQAREDARYGCPHCEAVIVGPDALRAHVRGVHFVSSCPPLTGWMRWGAKGMLAQCVAGDVRWTWPVIEVEGRAWRVFERQAAKKPKYEGVADDEESAMRQAETYGRRLWGVPLED